MSAWRPLWGRAVVASLLMGAWLQGFFLYPLKDEALDMHRRQLDPTEIVLVPYDLTRLWLFVSGPAFIYLVSTTSWKHVLILTGMTICTWIAYIVYGASPTENLLHTLAAAFYLMLTINWDPPVLGKAHKDRQQLEPTTSSFQAWERLSLACRMRAVLPAAVDRLAITQTRCILGLTMLLHILRLYDRGWQAQRWPVPTIVGASWGWIAGIWIGLAWEQVRSPSAASDNKKGSL